MTTEKLEVLTPKSPRWDEFRDMLGRLEALEVEMDEALARRTDESGTKLIISEAYFRDILGAISCAIRLLYEICEIDPLFEFRGGENEPEREK